MPQVSGTFGPIPYTVVLDGSGNGTVSFTPNGSAVRLTNVFVKVSTSTAQAVCTLYKGQVATTNQINQTNSGSTGAAASGVIDLFDGETLLARWTGGDAGATATLTVVGHKINPLEVGSIGYQLVWDNPIAAGDGSIIFPALKSPNYVANTSGWRIARDGTAEFANVTVRGELWINGSNNAYIHGYVVGGLGPAIEFNPPDVSGATFSPMQIYAASSGSGATATPELQFNGMSQQTPAFIAAPEMIFTIDTANACGDFQLYAAQMVFGGDNLGDFSLQNRSTDPQMRWFLDGVEQGHGFVVSAESTSDSAAIGTTETVLLTTASTTFNANRAFMIEVDSRYTISAAGPQNPVMGFHKTNAAGASLGDIGRFEITTTNTVGYTRRCIFTTGSSAVTAAVCCTISVPASPPTITQKGSAGSPRAMRIFDIGPASRYPNQTQLT